MPVMRLGIVGAGAIARGLAHAASDAHEIVLWARREESAERARGQLEERAEVVTDLEQVADAEVVVEAITEDHDAKCQLHGRLGEMLPDDSLLSSTTSSLSVAALARASGRPDRFAAVHFFNPVERMKLVELAFPEEATDQTKQRFHQLCEELGKTAVEVPDSAGFVVNRLLFPYLFDAVRLAQEGGLEPQAVDTCMKLGAGHPMGPLALLDFVGLDVAIAIGESIGAQIPERVRELAAEGKLGRKSGVGFYEYG
jgi:3-hydroxybutyryl-CoA dehydrogenase